MADLSVNHVERFVLRCGHIVQRVAQDYGYDLIMITFDAQGEVENGLLFMQVKATDHLRVRPDGRSVVFTLEVRDLGLWWMKPLSVTSVG